jgi:hypothetical protein
MKVEWLLRGIGSALLAAALSACFATAGVTELTEAGHAVRTGKGEPGAGYIQLETVTATHGNGCGRMGQGGTYEGALNALRNAAAKIDADYVRIDVDEPPHYTPECFTNTYSLSGTAFQQTDAAPPTPATTPDIPSMGVERAPCYPNRTCNEGLTCASDLCVRLEPAPAAPAEP